MAYATLEDLEVRWRALSAQERVRATALLDDAAVELDALAAPPGELTPDQAGARKTVSCRMVIRAMKTPPEEPAVARLQTTVGQAGQSVIYANPSGGLYLTGAERRLLGVGAQRAGSASLLGRDGP